MTDVWAVIPTHGRPVFWDALNAAVDQCERVIVVANNGFTMDEVPGVRVIPSEHPSNIHVWWNTGLDAVPAEAHSLVINDDCILGPKAVERLSTALEVSGAEISHPRVRDGRERIAGWCWMLRAGSKLRADESFGWWWGDDDLQRRAAGLAAVEGIMVEHRYPNLLTNITPGLSEQTGRDLGTFLRKWGST